MYSQMTISAYDCLLILKVLFHNKQRKKTEGLDNRSSHGNRPFKRTVLGNSMRNLWSSGIHTMFSTNHQSTTLKNERE